MAFTTHGTKAFAPKELKLLTTETLKTMLGPAVKKELVTRAEKVVPMPTCAVTIDLDSLRLAANNAFKQLGGQWTPYLKQTAQQLAPYFPDGVVSLYDATTYWYVKTYWHNFIVSGAA